jgi:hypothetical protein
MLRSRSDLLDRPSASSRRLSRRVFWGFVGALEIAWTTFVMRGRLLLRRGTPRSGWMRQPDRRRTTQLHAARFASARGLCATSSEASVVAHRDVRQIRLSSHDLRRSGFFSQDS